MKREEAKHGIHKFKPSVPKPWLYRIAGLLWTFVGVLLCTLAFVWLINAHHSQDIVFALLGIAIAIPVGRFGFSRLAQKNIARLNSFGDRICVFAFQAWKSYLIILIMITLGTTLRHSGIPKEYLEIAYISIGGGLLFASFRYYARIKALTSPRNGMPND